MGQIVIFVWWDNEVVAFGLKQAQLTALAVVAAAIAGLLLLRRWQQRQDSARKDVGPTGEA